MEARIVNWDEYGDLSATMAAINHSLDLTDAYIREAGASLEAAGDIVNSWNRECQGPIEPGPQELMALAEVCKMWTCGKKKY